MTRWLPVMLLGLAVAALPPERARAVACTLDLVPAATLLLPYFDVDTRDLAKPKPKRETTLVWVTNLGPAATIARVTLWTDLGVPTLAFDLYLTGYDVEEVDLWRVFQGALPQASVCKGAVSELSTEQVLALRAAHAGQPDPTGGTCSGADHGDTLLRGYLTVDATVDCRPSLAFFPSAPDYFGSGGIASNDNILGGQYFVQSRKQKLAESGRLVAIEADELLLGPGDATFYGRFVGYSGADAREPLPTSWGLRYLNDLERKRSTELLVWRSSEAIQAPFACESRGQAGWFPLSQSDLVSFDDSENAEDVSGATPLPAETNRVPLGEAGLPVTPASGWLFLALGLDDNPGLQSHVTARLRQGAPSARGLVEATVMDPSGCRPAPLAGTPIP